MENDANAQLLAIIIGNPLDLKEVCGGSINDDSIFILRDDAMIHAHAHTPFAIFV